MGLLLLSQFSTIPNFIARAKRVQKEREDQMLRHEGEIVRTYIAARGFSSTGVGQTIFTVPAGKEFILLSAFCSQTATNASGSGIVEIATTNTDLPFVISTITITVISATDVLQDNNSVNFGRGLRFKAGDVFTLEAGSSQAMIGGISGFVVESKLK